MSNLSTADAKERMWDEIDDVKVGMLGMISSGQHLQPMSAYIDREAGALWFITATDTDLARAVGQGAQARYTTGGKNGDFWVDATGMMTVSQDEEKLDEIWNAIAAAWFPEGRESGRILLLRMDLQEAAIWTADASKIGFLWEIAKANLGATHETPDVGDHVVVNFAHAA